MGSEKIVAVVGDSHGQDVRLMDLMYAAHEAGARDFRFLGDLHHGGGVGGDLGVWETVELLVASPGEFGHGWKHADAELVFGNHEEMLWDFGMVLAKAMPKGTEAVQELVERDHAKGENACGELWARMGHGCQQVLEAAKLYSRTGIMDPNGREYLVIHAGITPDMWFHGNSLASLPSVALGDMSRAERKVAAKCTRVRWLKPIDPADEKAMRRHPSGWKMAQVGANDSAEGLTRWWDLYDEEAADDFGGYHLVVGHEPVREVTVNRHGTVTAIDTGAKKRGGKLTAMLLQDGAGPRFLSVSTRGTGEWFGE